MNKIVLILIIISTIVYSQATQEWVARYNGQNNQSDEGVAVVADNSGNVYVTGSTIRTGVNYRDYVTIKYNSSGIQQWVSYYTGNGNNDDLPCAIARDISGNIYVTGFSVGNGTGYDILTIKYNGNTGDTLWVRRYNNPGQDGPASMILDNSGNVYITGYKGPDYGDFLTLKYNTTGDLLWSATFDANGSSDRAVSICLDNSGNVCITGAASYSIGTTEYETIKYNNSGIQQWAKRFRISNNNYNVPTQITTDNTGNIYVTGWCDKIYPHLDYLTIKYNSAGDTSWVRTYRESSNTDNKAFCIAVDNSGNVIVTGTSDTYRFFITTLKYTSTGNLTWVKHDAGPNDFFAFPNSMKLDNTGNIYITGYSYYSKGNESYFYTVKYNTNSDLIWYKEYNGPITEGEDVSKSIYLDNSGNVYVTGLSVGSGTLKDLTTIKYSQIIGIHPISTEIPGHFSLEQNYPNPFNPTTKIQFAMAKISFAKLVVYDALGREIETLVSERLNAGTYEADWNADKFSSGVYFYKLTAGDFTETKKMVLMK